MQKIIDYLITVFSSKKAMFRYYNQLHAIEEKSKAVEEQVYENKRKLDEILRYVKDGRIVAAEALWTDPFGSHPTCPLCGYEALRDRNGKHVLSHNCPGCGIVLKITPEQGEGQNDN